jgi:CRP-like cAMP-binding protein
MLLHLCRQVRNLTDRVYEFSTLAVRNRIQAELLRLSRSEASDKNNARIAPAPTHAELASRVATHREAVTRELRSLTKLGVIEKRGRDLVILDIDRLAGMVDDLNSL